MRTVMIVHYKVKGLDQSMYPSIAVSLFAPRQNIVRM